MSYEVEEISQSDWERMKEMYDVLESISTPPQKRAIDRVTNDFFVEIGNDHDRREGDYFRRGLFSFNKRNVIVSITTSLNSNYRVFQTECNVWEGIGEDQIKALNDSLICAISTLYEIQEHSIVLKVYNPYAEIQTESLIFYFDAQAKLWCDSKRYQIMNKYVEELNRGKQSLFKWRFHLAKFKGLPKYTEIDPELIRYLQPLLINPKHKVTLLNHLDEGGSHFCDDTKRVLAFIRNADR